MFWWLLWTSINWEPVFNSFRPHWSIERKYRERRRRSPDREINNRWKGITNFQKSLLCCDLWSVGFWGFPSVDGHNSDLLATRPWRIISPTVRRLTVRGPHPERERRRRRWRRVLMTIEKESRSPSSSFSLTAAVLQNSGVLLLFCIYIFMRFSVGLIWLRLYI